MAAKHSKLDVSSSLFRRCQAFSRLGAERKVVLYNKETKKPLGKDQLVVGEEVMVESPFGDGPFPAVVHGPGFLETTHHLISIAWENGEWKVLGSLIKSAMAKIELY